nr:cag pathogenicity island protein [Helicobacter pylori]
MIKAKLIAPNNEKRSFDKREVIVGKRGLGGLYRLPPNTVKPLALGE